VRIYRIAIGIHVVLEDIITIELVDATRKIAVALIEHGTDFRHAAAGQLQAQHVVLDRLPPDFIERLVVCRPRGLLAVVVIGLLHGKVEILFQQIAGIGDALVNPREVNLEDGERCREILGLDRIVMLGFKIFESGDVAGQEEHPVAIKGLEVFRMHLA